MTKAELRATTRWFFNLLKVNSLPRGLFRVVTRLKILLGHLCIFHQTNSILIVLPSERNILYYSLMFALIRMSVTFYWLSFVFHLLTFFKSLEVSQCPGFFRRATQRCSFVVKAEISVCLGRWEDCIIPSLIPAVIKSSNDIKSAGFLWIS